MSRIRSRDNFTTELAVASMFRAAGVKGWRRQQRLGGGWPDFVFPKQRLCVFVDGCFWHGCPRCFREPTSNVAYWREKIARNRRRDRRIGLTLRRAGYRVFRLWECRLKKPAQAAKFIARLKMSLR